LTPDTCQVIAEIRHIQPDDSGASRVSPKDKIVKITNKKNLSSIDLYDVDYSETSKVNGRPTEELKGLLATDLCVGANVTGLLHEIIHENGSKYYKSTIKFNIKPLPWLYMYLSSRWDAVTHHHIVFSVLDISGSTTSILGSSSSTPFKVHSIRRFFEKVSRDEKSKELLKHTEEERLSPATLASMIQCGETKMNALKGKTNPSERPLPTLQTQWTPERKRKLSDSTKSPVSVTSSFTLGAATTSSPSRKKSFFYDDSSTTLNKRPRIQSRSLVNNLDTIVCGADLQWGESLTPRKLSNNYSYQEYATNEFPVFPSIPYQLCSTQLLPSHTQNSSCFPFDDGLLLDESSIFLDLMDYKDDFDSFDFSDICTEGYD